MGRSDRRHAGRRTRRISRRKLLSRGAVGIAGTTALAGCTDDVGDELPPNEHWPIDDVVPPLPVAQRGDVLEARIDELAGSDVPDVDAFVATLEARSIAFESVSEVADLLHLEYVADDLERDGTLSLAGSVAGAYASLVDAGFEARGLELVFTAPVGATMGVLEVATEWAVRFLDGALSAGEYGELVASSLESARAPPDPDVAPDE